MSKEDFALDQTPNQSFCSDRSKGPKELLLSTPQLRVKNYILASLARRQLMRTLLTLPHAPHKIRKFLVVCEFLDELADRVLVRVAEVDVEILDDGAERAIADAAGQIARVGVADFELGEEEHVVVGGAGGCEGEAVGCVALEWRSVWVRSKEGVSEGETHTSKRVFVFTGRFIKKLNFGIRST